MNPTSGPPHKPIIRWSSVISIVLGLLLPIFPAAAQELRQTDEVTKLGNDVYLFRHQSHQALFLVTPEGVILTDPISLDAATWLKAKLARLTDQPVRYVIYSHHITTTLREAASLPTQRCSSAITLRERGYSAQRIPRRRFHSSHSPIVCPSIWAANISS